GCGKCIQTCPFGAIKEMEFLGMVKADVIETIRSSLPVKTGIMHSPPKGSDCQWNAGVE
ncbi:MAG: 4Fe-4S binding protein, partial [Proteobacteria bacterium]|nr:4Fe-4S binding protein [Pseudomonadota bacterium]